MASNAYTPTHGVTDMTAPASTKVILPIRTANAWPLRVRQSGDVGGGWSTIECDNVAHAREVMAANPQASMPCWSNPFAAWNVVQS